MNTPNPARDTRIAIVGVSALFPGSIDKHGFWKDIFDGSDLLTDVPATHWLVEDYYDPDPKAPDKTYAKRGAFLNDVDFDALAWGVPPSIMEATDTSQLLSLIVAQRVLDEASGGQFATMDKSRISVILGVTSAQELLAASVSRLQRPMWVKGLRDAGVPEDEVEEICERIAACYTPWQESTFPGLLGNVVAGRIANRLDLGGTNCVTDAACASTFSAISMGVSELLLGDSDLVVTGGVDTLNDIFMFMCFSKTPALSPSGDCRPFSAKGDGTMLGEGIGMVALKRLDDAERDGDPIYAVLAGVGSSSDGRSKSVYAPVSAGQSKALIRAYDKAGYGPETVELVEAHGTGTVAGDAAEFNGLRLAFEPASDATGWCALGSVKSQIGHTKAAAGAAGLFKAVMALHHKVIPTTLKIDEPNPKLDIENSPFYLSRQTRPWVRGSDHPRRASVSSFGFGGSNFHLTLEEYRGARRPGRLSHFDHELIVLTAADAHALAERCIALAADLPPTPDALRWLAQSTQRDADVAQEARLAVVASSLADLERQLRASAERIRSAPSTPFVLPNGTAFGLGVAAGDIAFLFPGQGSQYVGMGAELAMSFTPCMAVWDAAADVPFEDGTPLQEVVFPRPGFGAEVAEAHAERLTQTMWAQPAIGAASLSQLALVQALGITPAMMTGHSFGELTALAAANVFEAEAFLRVARTRGELMHEAAKTPGAMLALPLSIEVVESLIERHGADVCVANHNHPEQVVVSGTVDAVLQFQRELDSDGYETKRLPVGTAFHSPVVADSCTPFGEALANVECGAPSIPVYSGVTAAPHADDPDAIRAALAAQIAQPIRFVDTIRAMYDAGARTFIEIGPRSVLTGLTAKILDGREHLTVSLDRKGKRGTDGLLIALARLFAHGVPMTLDALLSEYQSATDPSTHTPPRLAIPINGSNYGKPYPPPGGAAALPKPNPPRATPAAPTPAIAASSARPPAVPQPTTPLTPSTPVNDHASGGASAPPAPASAAPAPSAPAYGAPALAAPAMMSADWLAAFRETQRRTAEMQAMYTASMAQAHAAYLQMAQASLMGLAGMPAPAPLAYAAPVAAPAPVAYAAPLAAPAPAPMPVAAAYAAPVAVAPVAPAPAAPAAPAPLTLQSPIAAPAVAAAPAPAPAPAPAVAAAPAPVAAPPAPASSASADIHGIMLRVVAESTGYPSEMLSSEMALEGDLGIDSIKRVEILSAVQDEVPGLPQVDANHMGALETLGEIVSYMQSLLGPAPAAAASPAVSTAAAPAAAAPAATGPTASHDVHAIMLEVVAESTGYPSEMLSSEMALEGDLGIDSIKRVEILSAVQDRIPGLPDVDANHMGALETLGEIVAYMQSLLGETSPARTESLPFDGGVGTTPGLGRYVLETVPAPASGFAQPGLFRSPVSVTRTEDGLSTQLVALLRAEGVDAHEVEVVAEGARAVVYLGGLRDVRSIDDATATQFEAFAAARTLAQGLDGQAGLWVTVQDTGGSFGLTDMPSLAGYTAGLAALTRTAAHEWPAATTKAIDLERSGIDVGMQARRLADELLRGGVEREVGLVADGTRVSLRSRSVAVAPGAPVLSKGDVVVVSGGARGVTAACVVEWAYETQATFVLLGRTPLEPEPASCVGIADDAGLKRALLADAKARGVAMTPAALGKLAASVQAGREVRDTIARVQEVGGRAVYVTASVTDAVAVKTALDGVRSEIGPITGVVHAAGVLADKWIAEKSDADFRFVFDTKIDGLRALLDATAEDSLNVVAVFSSVAARCGNQGQCDYAMANEVLTKVCIAEARRRPGCVVKSFGWGPWEGGMVTPQLRARFEALGVAMIPIDTGARMFVDELVRGASADVDLVFGGEPKPEPLLGASDDAPPVTMELAISALTHPHFADHTIQGTPVVPLVAVVDWFSRAIRAAYPTRHLDALDQVRVLRGIRLDGFRNGGDRFVVRVGQPDLTGVVGLRLESVSGTPHYSASARLVDVPTGPSAVAPSLRVQPWTRSDIYGDVLFHGAQFQVIAHVEGMSDEGAIAVLRPERGADWPLERSAVDVAGLDGGLQLALLLTEHVLGAASLPMAIGQVRTFGPLLRAESTKCIAITRSRQTSGATTDVVFVNATGERVAELTGVQTVLVPTSGVAAS